MTMEKFREERKLGFVLSTLHAGSALKLWHNLAARAQKGDEAFFIFPGGKLGEPFRNSIYKLVNSSNIDGLISWASSISGSVPVSEVEDFHKKLKNIPFVTIGQKIQNHPSVEFDAYTGMKELVRHFIQVHGVRKLAFLRAPLAHTSAGARFRGFSEALSESGIDINLPENQRLITDPLSWYDGERALAQLCEERGLVPGVDFEAVIASSDLMAFAAVDYLKARGVRIPKDVLVGGFNDTEESRISIPAFSTVHMPHAELGIAAYEKLKDILGGMLGVSDSVLHSYPVIRESCGCNHTKIWNSSDSRIRIRSKEQFINEVCKVFRLDPQNSGLDNLFNALFVGDKNKFYELFKQKITDYFQKDGDSISLFTALALFRNVTCLAPEYIEKIIRHVTVRIPRIQERVLIEKQYEGDKVNAVISALKNDLLSVFDRPRLISVLNEHLGKIGVNRVAIVLFEDDVYSNYIGGFSPVSSGKKDEFQINTDEVRFSCEYLIPEKFSSDFSKGVFIVQPLFVEERSYGYIICNYSGCKGIVYEDLRSSVSAALQSIFLFEQTNEAKRIAEQAEFAKTEFFANVGSDLCDPLKNIAAKLQQMESNIEKGVLDSDILSEQLLFLRSQVSAQLEKTETLVDLTRSQVDDLPMDKKLFDIRQALPGVVTASLTQDFPLLYGDSERLKRSLQTIFDFSEKNPYIYEKSDGIHLEFYSNRFDWEKPELLLAEKIILLQFGSVEKSPSYVEITLPWPNLAGLPPENSLQDMAERSILCYIAEENTSAASCAEKFSLSLAYLFKEGEQISAEKAILFWEPDSAPIDEWIKVFGLRRNEALFRAPIICYSHNMIGHNFVDLLEQKIKTQRTAPVLFVNAHKSRYGSWATDSNTVSITSMEGTEFDEILSEITPSLIVFETIEVESIRKIRQNPKTVHVPIIILPEHIYSDEDVDRICSYPRIILCNRGSADSEQFDARIKAILAGDEILPPHTGAIVKKAILYLNQNAEKQIVRWKLADTVHVSEDYLTRIFHKEIGLSLWEYLNRYRINIATKMLLETNDTIYEIAEKTGFQDQAYFCRVFKKIYGVPPGKIRNK